MLVPSQREEAGHCHCVRVSWTESPLVPARRYVEIHFLHLQKRGELTYLCVRCNYILPADILMDSDALLQVEVHCDQPPVHVAQSRRLFLHLQKRLTSPKHFDKLAHSILLVVC